MIAPYAAFICSIFTVYETDKYSIITYHLLNQQTEALDLKISTQDSAISDIKENIELIGENTTKGQNQVPCFVTYPSCGITNVHSTHPSVPLYKTTVCLPKKEKKREASFPAI